MNRETRKSRRAILKVAAAARPPPRLLLRSDAVEYAATAAQARAEEDALWRGLSLSIDADDTGTDAPWLGWSSQGEFQREAAPAASHRTR